MRARVGTCISVSTGKSCTMSIIVLRLKESAFHQMLQLILDKIVQQSVAYNFGCRALYNLPWRASVSSHQVQCNIPTLRPYREKICTTLLNDAEILTTCGCVFWCGQIVYIRPYSLNTTTAFCFVTECSDVAVFFRLGVCACHNTSVLYLALTRVGLSVLLWT